MGLRKQSVLTASVLTVFSATVAQRQVNVTVDTVLAGKTVTILFETQSNSPLPAGTMPVQIQRHRSTCAAVRG